MGTRSDESFACRAGLPVWGVGRSARPSAERVAMEPQA